MGKHFFFSGWDVVELAGRFGTPLYVVSEEIIRDRCRRIRDMFLNRYPNTKAVFASKSFCTKAMCRIIKSEGLGLDVVSGGELFTAIEADFPTKNIVFHGNNKTPGELMFALKNGVGRIVVDCESELDLLESISSEREQAVDILFRISPGVEAKTHRYITTGQKGSKFGIPIEPSVIQPLVRRCMESRSIRLRGFHFHLGSQILDNSCYSAAVASTAEFLEGLKDSAGFIAEEFNAGGGYGVNYADMKEAPSLDYFTDALMKAVLSQFPARGLPIPSVTIEPGRWIVGEAGITLYTVGSIKKIPDGVTYIGIDGGMADNIRVALYGAKYKAFIANRMDEENNRVVTVAGKACETGDILIHDMLSPEVNTGDILAVMTTGAYNYSMAGNINRMPRPAVVLVSEGRADIIVERETWEDIVRLDKIPPHMT